MIGGKIRTERIRKGLSHEKMIFALHDAGLTISRATLQSWEAGKTAPRVDDLLTIAKTLGKEPEFFLSKTRV